MDSALSPLYKNSDDDIFSNNFSSEIHLKNNKNFILREDIYKNTRKNSGSQDHNSNLKYLIFLKIVH